MYLEAGGKDGKTGGATDDAGLFCKPHVCTTTTHRRRPHHDTHPRTRGVRRLLFAPVSVWHHSLRKGKPAPT